MPYVATTRTPASAARARSAGSTGPPPTQHGVEACAARPTSVGVVEHPVQLGRHQRDVAPRAGHRRGRVRERAVLDDRLGARRRSERNSTCSPATYDGGRFSSHWPGPPSRACVAAAEARIAARDSTHPLRARPSSRGRDDQRRRVVGGVPLPQQRRGSRAAVPAHGSAQAAHEASRYACENPRP